jgi:hypothetical protein
MPPKSRGIAVLLCTSVACGVLISLIHEQQQVERDALHQGVIRDKKLYESKLKEFRERGRVENNRRR